MNSAWPLVITLLYVATAMLIGLRARAGRSMNTLEEWGVAGRSMGPVTLYLLIAAGSVSAYTFMGAPGWAYSKGVAVFYVAVYLAYLALVAWYFGPKVWQFGEQFGHVTQASAIADRYQSPALGALSALVMAVGSVAYAVLQTIGSAYILFVMSGGLIPVWLGVLLVLACIAVYLYASGQRAIGRTNAFQGVLMLAVAWAASRWPNAWTACSGVSYEGSFLAAKSRRASAAAPSPSQQVRTAGRRVPRVFTTACAASMLSATAVGQFMTRIASASRSPSRISSAPA